MRILLLSLVLLFSGAASAQVMLGKAIAVDGDTIHFGDERFRLHGIDALEATQQCTRRTGGEWACGSEAKAFLANLISGKPLNCQPKGRDSNGLSVSTCRAGGIDLSAAMVRAGYAVALPEFSKTYVGLEAQARARGVGMWTSNFQMPGDYRSANPGMFKTPPPQASRLKRELAAPVPQTRYTYFRNCAEAWAAGAAPIYAGQPGYRPEMDGDRDGIACEPIRRRR